MPSDDLLTQIHLNVAAFVDNVEKMIPRWVEQRSPQGFRDTEIGIAQACRQLADAITARILLHILADPTFQAHTSLAARSASRLRAGERKGRFITLLGGSTIYLRSLEYLKPSSSPYRRLRLAMDYWCSLWFWPIEKADLLPTRQEYLFELSMILRGDVLDTLSPGQTLPLFSETQPEVEAREMIDELGYVNIDALCQRFERLRLVRSLAEERYRFLHWELEFAQLFAERGGFDLILGNPPWIRVQWVTDQQRASWHPRAWGAR